MNEENTIPSPLKIANTAPENWLCWRELVKFDNEDAPRLIVPHSDPMEYEQPLDGIFKTPEKAYEYLRTFGAQHEEELVLCETTVTPVRVVTFLEANDDGDVIVSDNDTGKVLHKETT